MAWYNASWDHRIKVTVDKDLLGGENQTDFPVKVDLDDMPDAFFTGAKADGSDIVVTKTDGTTKVNRDLIAIDTSAKTGHLKFLADTLSASTDTDFYIYYGNSAGAETNSTSTYPSIVKSYFPYDADVTDRSQVGNNGTATSITYSALGAVFNGSSSKVAAGTTLMNGPPTSGTVYGWIKPTGNGAGGAEEFQKPPVIAIDGIYHGLLWNPSTSALRVYWYTGAPNYYNFTTSISVNTLYHVAVTWSSTDNNTKVYVNGALDGTSGANIGWHKTSAHSGQAFQQGNFSTWYFQGSLKSWMFMEGARKADSWITAVYNNENSSSTFYAVGAEESNNTVPATPTISTPTNGATNQSRTPTLTASAFSDTDVGQTHAGSQWEVYTDAGFSSKVWDSGDTSTNLTSCVVNSTNGTFSGALEGRTTLASNTTYYWRVRYKDSAGGWSAYGS